MEKTHEENESTQAVAEVLAGMIFHPVFLVHMTYDSNW